MMYAYLIHDVTSSNQSMADITLSKLQRVTTGGQTLSVPLFKAFLEMFPHLTVVNVYGATETNLVCREVLSKASMDTKDYGLMDLIDGVEIKIVDSDGQLVPRETKGMVMSPEKY